MRILYFAPEGVLLFAERIPIICLEDRAWSKGGGKFWEQLPFSSMLLIAITGLASQYFQLKKKKKI